MIQKIVSAVITLIVTILQFFKIYEKDIVEFTLGKTEMKTKYFNVFEAITSNDFGVFEKGLMLLFFIVSILVLIYFIFCIIKQYENTNYDYIAMLLIIFAGLMVFMLTSKLGHFVVLVPLLLILSNVIIELTIKRRD